MTMKWKTQILIILPPALLLMLVGMAGIASTFTIRFDAALGFRIFSMLWILSSLACLVRGIWILKSDRQHGYICIALAFFYLFFLVIIQPAT
jgi:hypothetical protein